MFGFHTLNENGKQQVKDFKSAMARTVKEVEAMLPEGREKAIFMTKLEEAVFFGTKAIAGKQECHTSCEDF
jgi:hypothetical protein